MKAIILAAGRGSRMGQRTAQLPKGLLKLNNYSLVEYQMASLRSAGVDDLIIVTGYRGDCFRFPNVTYYHNDQYAETNMVETLMCAREALNGDCLVCYSDIIYTPDLVSAMRADKGMISLAVDTAWKKYWMARYGSAETDLETLMVEDGAVVELGKPVESSHGITHRYIGILKFSEAGCQELLDCYDDLCAKAECWPQSGKIFRQGYMTDIMQELVNRGVVVSAVNTPRQWLEFDVEQDIDIVKQHQRHDTLSEFFDYQKMPLWRRC